MDDRAFKELLDFFGFSWSGYKKVRKGVKKRIARHMEQLGCRHVDAYIAALKNRDTLRSECEQLMTVSISRFFRDHGLWETLLRDILSGLIDRDITPVNIWSAGCASGEEVYSLKIVWETLSRQFDELPMMEILATEMNPVYLSRAREGIYQRSSLKELPEEFLPIFFQSHKKHFAVKSFLKKGISWELYNLLFDVPEKRFHVILLRNNVLTYYGAELKSRAFRNVIERLEPEGFLIIGSHEQIPISKSELIPFRECSYVFQKP
jgi:chemotaxis protein methyltransferase CheR